jgi:hypothetical protein
VFMFSIPILQGHLFPPFKIYYSYVNFKLMLTHLPNIRYGL